MQEENVIVEIGPAFKGQLTPRDLIKATGTLGFLTNYSAINGAPPGPLFRLVSPSYCFEAGFTSTHFYLARNDERAETAIEPVFSPTGKVTCFAEWTPTRVGVLLIDESYPTAQDDRLAEIEKRKAACETPPTLPPNSLVAWARRLDILPVPSYTSVSHLNSTVIESLQSIQDKVSTLGLHHPFWDITYDGRKIVDRKPKREPDIQPTIHGLLFDVAVAKNLQVTPEYPIGGGQLDFLISGSLAFGGIASVCIEFKHAHSDKLIHGLLHQLPDYMRAQGSDFGIYGVMYFRGLHFTEPNEYQDPSQLLIHLDKRRLQAGISSIRVVVLNLSYQQVPSKL